MAAIDICLQSQLSRFSSDLLDHQCSESHLGKLVQLIDMETMELMATDSLELTRVEVDDIRHSHPLKPVVQRLEMFKKWLEKKQSEATYR